MKKISKGIISFVLAFILIFLSAVNIPQISAQEAKKQWKTADELIEELGFLNGIQMPAAYKNSYGGDIGEPYFYPNSRVNFQPEIWRQFFMDSKAAGFDICKFWGANGFSGFVIDDDGKVLGVTDTYLTNLETIFQIAQEVGIYVCFNMIEHFESYYGEDENQYKFDKLSQFIYKEEYTDLYINNWVKPVMQLAAKYPCVVMVDIFCEPEANGGLWNLTRGTSWENMRKYISKVDVAVKKYNPRVTTYCSGTGSTDDLVARYDGLGLDYYGYDYYSDYGTAHDTSELFLNKPFVYGEFGANSTLVESEEFLATFYSNALATAVSGGVKATYYWQYNLGGIQSLLNDKNLMRPATLAIRSWAWDREKQLAGTPDAMDRPAIMYSTDKILRWYGSRSAVKMTVQRSTDKNKWVNLVSFNPETDTDFEFASYMYKYTDNTSEIGQAYYYRIVAEDEEGNTAISEPSYAITKQKEICDDSENLIKGGNFEDFTNYINYDDPTQGWRIQYTPKEPYELITNGVAGENTYTGTQSIYNPNYMYQEVTLKPNTRYTFTFHYKYENKLGYWAQAFGLQDNWPTDRDFYDYNKSYYGTIMPDCIRPELTLRNGEWQRYTYTFNSGDITKIRVVFDSYYGLDDRAYWYLDDVYLFENPEI